MRDVTHEYDKATDTVTRTTRLHRIPNPDPHDYEPAGEGEHGPMATDPDCRICGQPKHWH